jgi:hypothetical protein
VNNRSYHRNWRRTLAIVLPGLLIALVICGAGYLAAWKKSVVVPEGSTGLVVRSALFGGHKFSVIPAGTHELSSLGRGARVLAFPTAEQQIPFQVRIVPGMLGKAADNLGDTGVFGRVKNSLAKPIHVHGTLAITLTDSSIMAIAEELDERVFDPDLSTFLETPVRSALGSAISEREDQNRFGEVASSELRTELASFAIRDAKVTITEVKETSILAERDSPLFENKVLIASSLESAKVRDTFAFSAFIGGAAIGGLVLLFLMLFLVAPTLRVFEGLHMVDIGGAGEVLGGLADVNIDLDIG